MFIAVVTAMQHPKWTLHVAPHTGKIRSAEIKSSFSLKIWQLSFAHTVCAFKTKFEHTVCAFKHFHYLITSAVICAVAPSWIDSWSCDSVEVSVRRDRSTPAMLALTIFQRKNYFFTHRWSIFVLTSHTTCGIFPAFCLRDQDYLVCFVWPKLFGR